MGRILLATACLACMVLAGCAAMSTYTHTYRWTDTRGATEDLFLGAAYDVGDVVRWHEAPPRGVYFDAATWTVNDTTVRVEADPVHGTTDDQNRFHPSSWRLLAQMARPAGTSHAAAHETLEAMLVAMDPSAEPGAWERSSDALDQQDAGWVALAGTGLDLSDCLGDTFIEAPVPLWEQHDLFLLLSEGHTIQTPGCTLHTRVDFAEIDVGPGAAMLVDVFGRAQLVLEGPRDAWQKAHELAAAHGFDLPQHAHHEQREHGWLS